jgi:hypothetical protein
MTFSFNEWLVRLVTAGRTDRPYVPLPQKEGNAMRMIALAAMLAAMPTFAEAAKLSLGQGINDDLPTVGAMDRHTVYLRKGSDYAIEYLAGDSAKTVWTMRSPSGSVLKSWEASSAKSYGFEFRAAVTGTYRIEGRAVEAGTSYLLRAAKDCRNKLPTGCFLNVGATQSRRADYGHDLDYIRLAGLTAGKLYTVTMATDGGAATPTFQLVDARGTVFSEGDNATFRLYTTVLFLRFRQDNDRGGGPYKVTLKSQP